jgi:predicted DNA-binding protein (MmcQ/YjbR family)
MPSAGGRSSECDELREELRAFALGFPEAWEDFPWEESVIKVGKKIFAFLGSHDSESCAALGVKLPESADAILQERWATPSSHGLGRSGWVTIELRSPDEAPLDLLFDLVVESYCAVAPKRLAAAYLAEIEG